MVTTNAGSASSTKESRERMTAWDVTDVKAWPKTAAELKSMQMVQRRALSAAQTKQGWRYKWQKGTGPPEKETVCQQCNTFHFDGQKDCFFPGHVPQLLQKRTPSVCM